MDYVGVDISLVSTGLVTINDDGVLVSERTIKSKPLGKTPTDELVRLADIRDRIMSNMPVDIGMVCIEGLAFGVRNATALAQLSGLNYMLREFLHRMHVPFCIVAPTSLKKFATGRGNSDKNMVMMEVFKRWGFSASNSDTSDAFVLAQMAKGVVELGGKYTKEQTECLTLLRGQIGGQTP